MGLRGAWVVIFLLTLAPSIVLSQRPPTPTTEPPTTILTTTGATFFTTTRSSTAAATASATSTLQATTTTSATSSWAVTTSTASTSTTASTNLITASTSLSATSSSSASAAAASTRATSTSFSSFTSSAAHATTLSASIASTTASTTTTSSTTGYTPVSGPVSMLVVIFHVSCIDVPSYVAAAAVPSLYAVSYDGCGTPATAKTRLILAVDTPTASQQDSDLKVAMAFYQTQAAVVAVYITSVTATPFDTAYPPEQTGMPVIQPGPPLWLVIFLVVLGGVLVLAVGILIIVLVTKRTVDRSYTRVGNPADDPRGAQL